MIEEGDAAGPQEYNLVRFCKDLLGTALEASDALISRLVRGLKRIPVRVPKGITTLKIDLSDREIDDLFDAGELDTRRSLDDWEPLKRSERAKKLQQQLRVIYGPESLFEPLLWALQKMMEERTKAGDLRASVMLPTGHQDGSRIVTYHYGFRRSDEDRDLVLDQFGGCSGCCLEHRKAVIADLEEATSDFQSKWRMTPEQQNKVAKDRRAMISYPIFYRPRDEKKPTGDLPVIGVLSVDSSTKLMDTGWGEKTSYGFHPERGTVGIMVEWSKVISELLRPR